MHQAGRETPLSRLGAHQSKPVDTTWCPCPSGQTRMKYDGASSLGVNQHSTAKLGARKREAGNLPADVLVEQISKLPGVLTKTI
jgi:hypothetical protein